MSLQQQLQAYLSRVALGYVARFSMSSTTSVLITSNSELPSLDLREVEDVVYEAGEGLSGGVRAPRVLLLDGIQRRVHQQIRESDDPVERSTDLVAHVREETTVPSFAKDERTSAR